MREIATLLRRLGRDEIAVAVSYLSVELPQGRIGVGYSALSTAAVAAGDPPAQPLLPLGQVDRLLGELAGMQGGGSAARRGAALRDLFSQATQPERRFLLQLLAGELRQGALVGVMLEAVEIGRASWRGTV